MLTDALILLGGGIGVWLGAEGMVRGAVKLAHFLGVPSLIIGLTVVAFGTSAPELVVSTVAAVSGHNQLALGNVIGSNIINIGLVLGISALISPMVIATDVLKRDIPMVLVVTLGVVLMTWIGDSVSRIDGIILLIGFAAHTYYCFKLAQKEQHRTTSVSGWQRPELKPLHIVFLVGGMILLAAGAKAMVDGAVGVAESFGVNKRIIGMTIVAFGTSVPELAASVVAAKQGESDMAIGNVVGSNLYNLLLILGTVTVITPISGQLEKSFGDFIFFVLTVLILVPMIRIGWRLGRMDGLILLLTFAVSVAFLFV